MPTVFYAQIISGLLYRNTKNVSFFFIFAYYYFSSSLSVFSFFQPKYLWMVLCTLIFWAKSQSFCNNNQHHLYLCTASFFSALKLLKISVFALKILSDLGHCIFFDVCILSADMLCNYEYNIMYKMIFKCCTSG